MKLIADPIILPDDASWQDKEDAKARANWHEVKSLEYFMSRTNLDGKCGSCKFFEPCLQPYNKKFASNGNCTDGIHAPYRARTSPACKNYQRREDV